MLFKDYENVFSKFYHHIGRKELEVLSTQIPLHLLTQHKPKGRHQNSPLRSTNSFREMLVNCFCDVMKTHLCHLSVVSDYYRAIWNRVRLFCETFAEFTNYVIAFCETMWKTGVTENES